MSTAYPLQFLFAGKVKDERDFESRRETPPSKFPIRQGSDEEKALHNSVSKKEGYNSSRWRAELSGGRPPL
jgi:hypothetical protein